MQAGWFTGRVRYTTLFLIANKFFMGLLFYSIVSSLFMQARGLSYQQIFWLESVLAVALFLFEIPSGVWADRIDRRTMIIYGNLANAVSAVLLVVAHQYWMFAFSFAVSGFGIALLSGTDSAYVYEFLLREGKEAVSTKLFGWLGATETIAMLVALPVGSWLAGFGLSVPVYWAAVAEGVALLCALALPRQPVQVQPKAAAPAGPADDEDPTDQAEPAEPAEPETPPLHRSLVWQSAKLIVRTPMLIFFALSGPAVWVIINAIHYLNQPLFLSAGLAIGVFGWVMAAAQGISVAGSLLAERAEGKLGTLSAIVLSSTLMAVCYMGLAWVRNPVLIVVLIGVLLASLSLRGPIMGSAVNALVPSHMRATTLSVLNGLGTVLTIALNPTVGHLADVNLTAAFLFCGGMILLLTFVYFPTLLRLRRLTQGIGGLP